MTISWAGTRFGVARAACLEVTRGFRASRYTPPPFGKPRQRSTPRRAVLARLAVSLPRAGILRAPRPASYTAPARITSDRRRARRVEERHLRGVLRGRRAAACSRRGRAARRDLRVSRRGEEDGRPLTPSATPLAPACRPPRGAPPQLPPSQARVNSGRARHGPRHPAPAFLDAHSRHPAARAASPVGDRFSARADPLDAHAALGARPARASSPTPPSHERAKISRRAPVAQD